MKKKIFDLNELKNYCQKQKKLKKKIVLAHGTFDLLHAGHILMLKEIKERCKYLVVGLQRDPSIRVGKSKPIQTEEERALQLSAVEYVDEVIVYDTEEDLVDFVVPMNYSSDLLSYMTNIKIMKDNISEDYIGKIIMGISVYNQTAESAIDKIFLARLNEFSGVSIFSYGVHRNNLDWFDPFLDSWKEP